MGASLQPKAPPAGAPRRRVGAGPPQPDLSEVWEFLRTHPQLREQATVAEGIGWGRDPHAGGKAIPVPAGAVRRTSAEGFRPGVPPGAAFDQFQKPEVRYLDFRPRGRLSSPRRAALGLPWNQPKAIVGGTAREHGRWRLTAYPDKGELACHQGAVAVWPHASPLDPWLLSAVLNSPVVNAFVATCRGPSGPAHLAAHVAAETLGRVPMPYFTGPQGDDLRALVRRYQSTASAEAPTAAGGAGEAARLLMEIDAAVLGGYRLPPRLEFLLLEAFRGQRRPVPHPFPDYLPEGTAVFFSLSDRLSPGFQAATAGELLKRLRAG